jgi:hypothetical protein
VPNGNVRCAAVNSCACIAPSLDLCAISAPDDHASVPFEVIANLVAKSVVATEFNATAINEFCSEIARAGNLRSLEE